MSKIKRPRASASITAVGGESEIIGLGLNDDPGKLPGMNHSAQSAAREEITASRSAASLRERMSSAVRGRWWLVAVIGLLSLSAFGATLKYLEEDAQRQTAERTRLGYLHDRKDESIVSKVNPFLAASNSAPTPQLSKEYIYAGSRMLAVEDANAPAAAPADLAVWRPSSGIWYVMGGDNTIAASASWGAAGDVTVPGDYDGDGKTDFAVYRPSNNTFYIIKSSDGSYLFQSWGTTNDKAVPADYDGDHRTDLAVYRATNHTWYILRSSDQTLQIIDYGNSTDLPAPADYDGDGKADAAVFRQSNSTFYIYRSSDNTNAQGQISTTSTSGSPVPADYDGDGKADCAMRDGANWLILQSSNNTVQTVGWYSAGDTAVQNDYDGDGKVDIAVWRPSGASAGSWYIRQSSLIGQANELRTASWGQMGDTPVPALWRR